MYLSLNGEVIPNHGYVEISDIGSSDTTALLCHTNKPPPPGSATSGGDWFAPDGTRVAGLHFNSVPGFERNRSPMVVRLRSTSGTPYGGIYECSVQEQGATDTSKVYVGLYNTGGGSVDWPTIAIMCVLSIATGVVSLSSGMAFTLFPSYNLFLLTCNSTGGPATTVTWTRDSAPAVGLIDTVLVDGVTGTSNNTLLVTGRMEGLYTCTVSNRVSNESSASLTVAGEDHTLSQLLSHFSSPPLTSSLSSLWCDGVSEWTEQSTSHLDTISWAQCHWLHHLLPATRWRTQLKALSGG